MTAEVEDVMVDDGGMRVRIFNLSMSFPSANKHRQSMQNCPLTKHPLKMVLMLWGQGVFLEV